ncbi:MAG: TRAP transporter substrate-binding protein DctP [Deltaproteobacteria bacterium]|nr:TRAP transporter substrate-binding protein DctP [Deltaproteobacteria bacterium]
MRKTKGWFVCLFALVFFMGMVTAGFAAKQEAAPETQDTKTYFGHHVDGLEPVTIIYNSDSPNNTGGDASAMNFKALVEAESKGKIKIDLHRFGSLYKQLDIPRTLPIGTIHFGNINKGLLMSRETGYGPWIIAYIWKSPEHLLSVVTSPEWYEMENELAKGKWNLKPLVNTTIGNWDYWSKTPMNSLKDFGGKKVWTYGELASAYIGAWGGTPVMKSTGEMYMAYYKGTLNVISFTVAGYLSYKFFDAGKYWLHMPTYPPGAVGMHYNQDYMNLDKWKSLPTAYKKIILDALDLLTWWGTWEGIQMEKLAAHRLINQHGVVDCGISTNYPEEYEKIKKAAVEAGKKYVFKRGVTQQQWDNAQAILEKYADPKYNSKYSWYFKQAWAGADQRLKDVEKKIKAGQSWDEACGVYEAKHRVNQTAEEIKARCLSVPRIKWNWNYETRLQ